MTEYRHQLSTIRSLAWQRLARLENGTQSPQQSYLFQAGNFVGIRFHLGNHHCEWMFGEPDLKFYQDGQPLVPQFVSVGQPPSVSTPLPVAPISAPLLLPYTASPTGAVPPETTPQRKVA